ncbi:hypothetical protein CNECB9_1090005 [Cupriavidus necator]|uniref:Uncharacterized protein n=1 Tax=Cupriavidus necator TaxID=106590 RepID=A0A1K0I8D0_CUPNE|nr:hypothetical protein CNECB9_1090005 [Cupriavidus necator]
MAARAATRAGALESSKDADKRIELAPAGPGLTLPVKTRTRPPVWRDGTIPAPGVCAQPSHA